MKKWKVVIKFMQENHIECYVNKQKTFPKNMPVEEGDHAVSQVYHIKFQNGILKMWYVVLLI